VLARTEGVSAVVAVNVYGVPPDLGAIAELAAKHGARLIYDDAHGFGTLDRGARVPSEPDIVTFSMHATKVLPAIEGGIVVARDPALARDVRRIRVHGLAADPLASTPGLNAKLDDLHAAVALHSLARIEEALARRAEYAERLRARAIRSGPALRVQRIPSTARTNHQNFSVLLDGDTALDVPRAIERLAAIGIEGRRYFYPALHRLARFQGAHGPLPTCERLADRILSLPLHARMSERDLVRVEEALDLLARSSA
jgi:dTDP-4-amino-4,6-dideoxygalactose transaminase